MNEQTFNPGLLISLLAGLVTFLKLRQDQKIASDARYHLALDRLNKALSKTLSYVANLEKGQPENRDIEEELANLWYEASGPCSFFDHEFGQRCQMKGAYWNKPSIWSVQQVEKAGIQLDIVAEQIGQMNLDAKSRP